MKKLFAAIFGTADHTKTVLDATVAGVDALWYTAEEKAENAAKFADWYLRYLVATGPQNLARRLIALVIVGLWAALVLAGVALWKVDRAYSEFIFATLKDVLAEPFLLVMGFYYAAHVIRSWVGDKK